MGNEAELGRELVHLGVVVAAVEAPIRPPRPVLDEGEPFVGFPTAFGTAHEESWNSSRVAAERVTRASQCFLTLGKRGRGMSSADATHVTTATPVQEIAARCGGRTIGGAYCAQLVVADERDLEASCSSVNPRRGRSRAGFRKVERSFQLYFGHVVLVCELAAFR